MGQSSVILAVAATLVVAVFLVASLRTSSQTDAQLAEYHNKRFARQAAITGIDMTARRLVADPDNWKLKPDSYGFTDQTYRDASFTVTVTSPDPDTVDVVATGKAEGGVHVIEARYAKDFITIGTPPAFKYAIISDDALTLNGQAEIIALDDESNANIHANGALTVNGKQVSVEGFGTFSPDGSGTVNPEKAIDDIFQPNVDGNGLDSNVYEGDYIDIPDLIPGDYDSIPPANLLTPADTTLSGVIDVAQWAVDRGYDPLLKIGTADNPMLWYVNGNLSMSGGVTLLGYIQIVTLGSITISGDVTATTVPQPDKNATEAEWDAWTAINLDAAGNTTIGMYANGDITVSGGSTVVGQLYSNQTITLNGGGGEDTNIIGGMTSSNTDINVNGSLVIRYAEISEKVVIPGFTKIVPEGVRLIAWAEW